MENLGQVVPSLTISTSANRPNVPAFAIRGQRNDAAFVTNDPSVGIYVAEAVQGRTFGLAQSLFDVESVQVLKGPQGTLFGRNTTGGAILFQPQRPTLGAFEGYVEGRLGNLERADLQGAVSIPLGERVGLRLAVNRTHRDGYIKDLNLGQRLNEEDTTGARAVLLIQPGDDLTNTLYVDYFDADAAGSGTRLTAVRPGGPADTRYGLANELARQNAQYDFHEVDNRIRARSAGRNVGATNVTEWRLSESLSLKNIFGYRQIEMLEVQDLDGTRFPVVEVIDEGQRSEQYSEELQLQGTSFGARLKWIVGAFWFEEDATRRTLVGALGNPPNPRFGVALNESKSLFAQGDWALTDALTLTLGGRYTWDRREFDQQLFSATTGACTLCAGAETESTAPTYTASLSWQISPSQMLYVASRRGYRSGGIDSSANNQAALRPFEPEEVLDYELGFKGDWYLGGAQLRTNLAVYHQDYDDIQRTVIGQVDGVPVTSIFNAASASIDGAEAEVTFATAELFQIQAGAAWTDPQYDEFFERTAGGLVDRSSNTFAYIPEWTYRIGVRAALPFGAAVSDEAYVRADYSWQDDIYMSEFNAPRNFQKAYGLLSARLGFNNLLGSGVDVGLWGRNLTNEDYYISAGDQYDAIGLTFRGLSEPRTWGVDVRLSF